MNQIAYKFVSWDVPALESLAGSKAYILRKRLNDGGTLTREEKDWITREVNHNTYFKDSLILSEISDNKSYPSPSIILKIQFFIL